MEKKFVFHFFLQIMLVLVLSSCVGDDYSTVVTGSTLAYEDLRVSIQDIAVESYESDDGSIRERYVAMAWIRLGDDKFSAENEVFLWNGRQIIIGSYRIAAINVTQDSVFLRSRIVEE